MHFVRTNGLALLRAGNSTCTPEFLPMVKIFVTVLYLTFAWLTSLLTLQKYFDTTKKIPCPSTPQQCETVKRKPLPLVGGFGRGCDNALPEKRGKEVPPPCSIQF